MKGRRSMGAPALGGLLAAVLTPAVAEAQLFPNLPTRKRERIDCSQELPVYGTYRHKYYGYYPTCWRRFPPGWGCPSPESPDWEAELARQPLDIPEDGEFGGEGPGDFGPDPFDAGSGGDLLPDLPGQRSPFDLDAPGAGASPFERDAPGAGASPFDERSPSRAPSPFDVDPFEPEAPGGAAPGDSAPPRSPFDVPGASTSPSELPSVTPPVTEAGDAGQAPFAMVGDPGSAPELAVIPDTRPRPIGLPFDATGPEVAGAPMPPEAGAMLPGMAPMPSQPMGMPGGMMPAPSSIAPMGAMPGMVDPGPQGVVISDPSFAGAEPVLMGPSEGRPRRRFLSGLFGRRD